ncbi:DUF1592 domain-containing protein [Thalassoroseus pseudoceratinae]|uniref:DUF1592 domain-containing protein n=1 Tax=Thalassoroseus pseudoceratinae TaxID=2713176 RepID=UPI00141FAA52|nr:DUF1592 domain-containing protein [Thalassoroseus pseudoceratinae]
MTVSTDDLIRIRCRSCGVKFNVHGRFAGRKGTCPNKQCAARFIVPTPPKRRSKTSARRPIGKERSPQTIASIQVPSQAAAKSQASKTPIPPSVRKRLARPKPARPKKRTWGWRGLLGFSSAVALTMAILLFRNFSGVSQPQTAAAASGDKDQPQQRSESPATEAAFQKDVRPFLEKYCFDCHADGVEEAGLAFDDDTTAEHIDKNRRQYEKALRMIVAEAMPPGDHYAQPTAKERERVLSWLDDRLFYVDCSLPPDPGRVTIQRLNRAEYDNTIRDLLGVDFHPAEDFPSDEVGYGFDNIGDVLSLPPLLFEKYVEAAEEVASRAIVADPFSQVDRRVAGRDLQLEGSAALRDRGYAWMASSGSVAAKVKIPMTSEYLVIVEGMGQQAGDEKAKLQLRIDGKSVHTFVTEKNMKTETFEYPVRLTEGQRKVEVAFINDYYNPKAKDRNQRDRNAGVRSITVKGPRDFQFDLLPESHQRVVFTRPGKDETPDRASEEILRKFLPRAFRRPVGDEEIERFQELVKLAIKRGDTFEQGIQLAVSAALVSPHFLFRVESDARPTDTPAIQNIEDYDLASRLSYFLWSSMPDKQLFELAKAGQLHKPDVLRTQVRRMLADPKSQAIVDNFAMQWLNLRMLDEMEPDPKLFPQFNEDLRKDMQTETRKFFETVMREDRNVFEFLDGDFTFVNERLAKLYGIGGVKGDQFRKVSLTGLPRRGVLTQGSILTLTSNPVRTSPVKRGKWVMENILGTPPPPAPPNVPELEETAAKAPDGASLREQLELHRKDPACASCHRVMDAIGFGFENFDAIGQWRDQDEGIDIDASADLKGSGPFNGPVELVKLLKNRNDDFRRSLAEKMLTYALGRGVEYYDRCAIDEITKQMKENGDRFSTLMTQVVLSDPFLKRRNQQVETTK